MNIETHMFCDECFNGVKVGIFLGDIDDIHGYYCLDCIKAANDLLMEEDNKPKDVEETENCGGHRVGDKYFYIHDSCYYRLDSLGGGSSESEASFGDGQITCKVRNILKNFSRAE